MQQSFYLLYFYSSPLHQQSVSAGGRVSETWVAKSVEFIFLYTRRSLMCLDIFIWRPNRLVNGVQNIRGVRPDIQDGLAL